MSCYTPPAVFPGAWIEDDPGVEPIQKPPKDIEVATAERDREAASVVADKESEKPEPLLESMDDDEGSKTPTSGETTLAPPPHPTTKEPAAADAAMDVDPTDKDKGNSEPSAPVGESETMEETNPVPAPSNPRSSPFNPWAVSRFGLDQRSREVKFRFRFRSDLKTDLPFNGGLVDKIIISQDSLKELINVLSPGAYTSLTKVDFKALDKLSLKPLGLYGSKSELISFLLARKAINDEIAQLLSQSTDNSSSPQLRSGLYVLRDCTTNPVDAQQIFVIYWPEPTTWNDDAISSVRRNRVTFMRYLTKISDQVACLISPEHARSIVWNDETKDFMEVDEESDRLFTFEVAKTNEQEENVEVRPGFVLNTPILSVETVPEDCTLDPFELQPTLVHGETSQAILTKRFVPSEITQRIIRDESYNPVKIKNLVSTGTIRLDDGLTDGAIDILAENGLGSRYPIFAAWKARNKSAKESIEEAGRDEEKDALQKIQEEEPELRPIIREAIVDRLRDLYPTVPRPVLSSASDEEVERLQAEYKTGSFASIHGKVKEEIHKATAIDQVQLSSEFRTLKGKLLCIDVILSARGSNLDATDRESLIAQISEKGLNGLSAAVKSKDSAGEKKGLFAAFSSWFSGDGQASAEPQIRQRVRDLASRPDAEFLAGLDEQLEGEPLLDQLVARTTEAVHASLQATLKKLLDKFVGRAVFFQQEDCKVEFKRRITMEIEDQRNSSRIRLLEEYKGGMPDSQQTMIIERVEPDRRLGYGYFKVSGCQQSLSNPLHTLQMNPTFVPLPQVQSASSHGFNIPLECGITRIQLLESGKVLLVLEDSEFFYIYLENPADLGHAVSRGRTSAKKALHRDKIGKDVIFAYDEQKRMLALCASHSLILHIYMFDETFTALQGWGSALDLKRWFSHGTFITQSCFISGCEEILFIDTSAEARIFSLVTQQFRPASLSLEQPPNGLYSSPDGSCLILSFRDMDCLSFRAYHWSTFGSTQGIDLGTLDLPDAPIALTSLVNRRNIHLIGIDVQARACRSLVFDITKKTTEFMFKETGALKGTSRSVATNTAHNCLIDCHSDCWTRFPVVPAVQRRTVVSSTGRTTRKLVFVTDRDHDRFAPHFTDMIYAFEQRTKKPTGDVLKSIQILTLSSGASFPEPLLDDLSHFRAGEWLVDILCLIPIQIAVTRENRFVPLKDGIISASQERALLGAEVGQIVDSITFSWMESVFQSYMTSKPVKVVSSMGEQSVGKSFSLNHLADSSFAGSAMRTTEGVWMSVTPTDEALIVALDFEGVHSIERSAQEDTLLVLFNTAISNLVLFRNNFAMSRSIAGLFQSFQSSSTVLDPAANPSLFRSVLVIIIKDVVESDKKEIVKEFSTKFQKIVEDEQDANFISRLHAGQLNIVPWPVIESKQFYSLFPSMKRLLDKQEVTHRTAGEFLHTLKTLMAKLKANDWGSLSQTLVAHRAQKLLNGLNNAMAFGLLEVEPDIEPLKNFDTDESIDDPDTLAQFFLSSEDDPHCLRREELLAAIQRSWGKFDRRTDGPEEEWIGQLSAYLDQLADIRIQRVHAWISSNLSRFKTNHANIETLKRVYQGAVVDLKANVELCGTQCAQCQLKCLLSRRHDSSIPHDCQTSHQCVHPCNFEEQGVVKACGLPAGHPGRHICAVEVHLCGEPCGLKDKQGCLGGCMKVARHAEDGHMCSARTHKCGEPCALKNLRLGNGKIYTCKKTCNIPSDEEHTQHVCDSSACPVACELCKRLCSNTDHLHGLERGAVHLCGQTHNCSALCQADGTCEIETAPQSVEATFTGQHETFQYTKYSQVAKRRPCIFPIPAGEKRHAGPHNHSADANPFHFCEARCESCGYFCTLPRGHAQQEHETSHGSMSKTRWAVDGPDGTILELNGRKFGSDDDGAPMMCNLVCQEIGRHAHVDYCRADDVGSCDGAGVQHILARMNPNPARPKDWISHSLFWARTGFKDPYSRPDQTNFAKCDAMCPDTEHAGTASNPSYCVLPLFHPPATQAAGLGYLSNDGHVFNCKNPSVMHQAFHVIFVIDRSASMGSWDRRPLPNTPGTALISSVADNRLGAVYSALHAFWMSRNTALGANNANQGQGVRRDAYSVVMFDQDVDVAIANDFNNTPDQLLTTLLAYQTGGGTNFTLAISQAEAVMRQHWSTERTPVVIFLSDGECSIAGETVRSLSRAAVALGKPLSFHSVSFGTAAGSAVLSRMAQLALEVQNNAPRDPLTPAGATIDSSYSEALDTVRLAETFFGFAESLRKPRGALFSAK